MYAEPLIGAFNLAAETIMAASGEVVVLTGAGISVASGIPAFRGNQGLWDRYDPFEYAEISSFRRNPEKVWTMFRDMLYVIEKAEPNRAHKSLAEFAEKGFIKTIITQNVDGLHQAAGNCKVIEFHGTTRNLICPACGWCWASFKLAEVGELLPRCQKCDVIMKPDVVFFGEEIPRLALFEATAAAEKAKVILVIGTSANVYPAADMPLLTKRAGGRVIEINLESTPISGSVADQTILGPAAAVLPEILAICENRKKVI